MMPLLFNHMVSEIVKLNYTNSNEWGMRTNNSEFQHFEIKTKTNIGIAFVFKVYNLNNNYDFL